MRRRDFLAALAGLIGGLPLTSFSRPRTWVAGQAVTAAAFNTDIRDNLKNVDERLTLHGITDPSTLNRVKSAVCGVRLGNTGDETVADATSETLSWDTEDVDTDGFHDASQPARITIPAGLGGYYLISAAVRWQANAGGVRRLWIEDSAGTVLARLIAPPAGGQFTHQTLTSLALLTPGTYIIARVYQDSGSNLTATQSIVSAWFAAYRIFAS